MAHLQDSESGAGTTRSFDWLGRSGRGSAYISYNGFSHLSATSFDFGHKGYAASCNYGGEILQLSAPSAQHGLIFASGDFSPSLYASLARRQRAKGGPATFGLKPSGDRHNHPSSIVRLDRILERGTFNYRWPFTEYSLVTSREPEDTQQWRRTKNNLEMNGEYLPLESLSEKNSSKDDAKLHSCKYIKDKSSRSSSGAVGEWPSDGRSTISRHAVVLDPNMGPPLQHESDDLDRDAYICHKTLETQIGTCAIFSFVRGGVLYQVVRIGSNSSPESEEPWPEASRMDFTIGGPIRFHHHDPFSPKTKNFPLKSDERSLESVKYCLDDKKECLTVYHPSQKIALQARVYQHISDKAEKPYEPKPLDMRKGETNHGGEICRVPISLQQSKSITLVAAFRLVEWDTDPALPWTPQTPISPDVYHYIGGDGTNPRAATATLWDKIIHQRYLRCDSLSQITDVHLLGRCFEKIVHVDTIPLYCGFDGTDACRTALPAQGLDPVDDESKPCNAVFIAEELKHLPTSSCRKTCHGPPDPRDGTLALVSNLFMEPEISYSTLFWKVRFMVKMYQFFHDIEKESDIAQHQNLIVEEKIRGIVLFLIRQLKPQSSSPILKSNRVKAKPDFYYILITIWFCVKNLPDFDWEKVPEDESGKNTEKGPKTDSKKDSIAASKSESIKAKLKQVKESEARKLGLGNDDDDFGMAKEEIIPLLQWYQYGSILQLTQGGYLNRDVWNEDTLRKRVYELRRAALVASAARTSSGRPYRASDEVVDRLEFLAHELQLEKNGDSHSVASFASHRIRDREFTSSLNPGLQVTRADGAEDHTDGPWEVHALCHHSRLMTVNMDYHLGNNWRMAREMRKEVELYKGKLSQFLNSEATLTPCWERSYLGENKSWGQSEATSILGSTLLDIDRTLRGLEKLKKKSKKKLKQKLKERNDFHDPASSDSMATAHTEVFRETTLTDSRMNQRIRIIEKGAPDAGSFQWRSWRPPRLYHPENFMMSLDDTPHKYRSPEIGKTAIPSALLDYVDDPQKINNFKKKDLENLESELDTICVADLVETESGFEDTDSIVCAGPMIETNDSIHSRENLVYRLHDSLVDLNVRHRFFVVASQSLELRSDEKKQLRNTLVYVMCPWSAACLNNHLVRLARFKCQTQNDWIARITVIGWKRCKRPHNKELLHQAGRRKRWNEKKKELRDEGADEMISLPAHFDLRIYDDDKGPSAKEDEKEDTRHSNTGNSGRSKEEESNRKLLNSERFELRVSSFVLATNPFGDFSKCTILSEEINGKELREIAEKAQSVWRVFVHQPQTARCLVFLLVLGRMASDMIKDYSHAADLLRSVLGLDQYLKPDVEFWPDEAEAIERFQHVIWSLESLYKLQRSLEQSLRSITEAKDEMLAQIKDGSVARSDSLEGICQEHTDSFESRYSRLCAEAIELERVIELNTRYKDASEAILNLTGSRTSLRQNRTIERLTYLTIMYLPMGLMAAIFAIPPEQHTVFPNMGRGWFTGGIFLMFIVTSFIAVYVLEILRLIRNLLDDYVEARCGKFIKRYYEKSLNLAGQLRARRKSKDLPK